MRRMLAFLGGLMSGAGLGTAVALLFVPTSGTRMRQNLRQRWADALVAGQQAAAQKRAELEAQLIDMTGPHSPDSPMLRKPERPAP